jgi:hypothetical protein
MTSAGGREEKFFNRRPVMPVLDPFRSSAVRYRL